MAGRRALSAIPALVALAGAPAAARGEPRVQRVYTWRDAAGVVHYTNGLDRVPPKYRRGAKPLTGEPRVVDLTDRSPRRRTAWRRPEPGVVIGATPSGGGATTLTVFTARWCGACKRLDRELPEVRRRLPLRVRYREVDVDDRPDLAASYAVRGIPTLVIERGGEVVDRISGARPAEAIVAWAGAAAR